MRIPRLITAAICLLVACVRPPAERRGSAGTRSDASRSPDGFPGERLATHFAVIGDYGLAGPNEASVAALVAAFAPDFVLTLGDNNYFYGGADTIDDNVGQYYHQYIGGYQGSYGAGADQNRFFASLGNHDWMTPGAQPYLEYFQLPGNGRYYDVAQGDVHLFALDSDPSEPDGVDVDSIQAAWLRTTLAAAAEPWKVVYMHHPAYSSGPHGSTAYMQWPFKDWGASLVLAGHDHLYEHLEKDGLTYLVDGVGGAETYAFMTPIEGSLVRYTSGFGALLIDADSSLLRARFYDVSYRLVDELTLSVADQ